MRGLAPEFGPRSSSACRGTGVWSANGSAGRSRGCSRGPGRNSHAPTVVVRLRTVPPPVPSAGTATPERAAVAGLAHSGDGLEAGLAVLGCVDLTCGGKGERAVGGQR